MRILFCRIGWTKYYKGDIDDTPKRGGKYNKDNVGHENYNFLDADGEYFGYARINGDAIHLEKIDETAKGQSELDNVLVIWFATHPREGGQYIVGWYRNATVYAEEQPVPENAMNARSNFPESNKFITKATDVHLIPEEDRRYYPINIIDGKAGQSNIWYGNDSAIESAKRIVDLYYQRLAAE